MPDSDELDLLNECLGTNLPFGTRFDLAEIETDLSSGNRRIEFGVSFISIDLSWSTDSDYRAFPSLEEIDGALYFVVEEANDSEILNAIGRISEFTELVVEPIAIAGANHVGDLLTIEFGSAPDVTWWRIKGDSSVDETFPDDLTSAPGNSITESAVDPGQYTAVVNVAGRGPRYFQRIER